MRALALHEDLIVVVSAVWQTTCTLVRAGSGSGNEGFVIDSPVLPEELDALAPLAERSGFPVSGLLCTHADWDHLLGRLAFPEAQLGLGERSAERLAAEPGDAQRRLRAFDEQFYVDGRRPLGLGGGQVLPVPGRLSLGGSEGVEPTAEGDARAERKVGPERKLAPEREVEPGREPERKLAPERELELHAAPGHTADGTAFWLEWLGTLVCGDYLSPVEIPMLGAGGSATAYLETLARLAELVERADTVVPGHGRPLPRADAQRLLAEDVTYLERLLAGGDAPLPDGRRGSEQRRIHADNLARISNAGGSG